MAIQRNPLILASASPRRKLLMRKAGYRFEIIPSNTTERARSGLSPAQRVNALALKKAIAVARLHPGRVVLGADTLVFVNGRAIGKPRDVRHARRMLKQLSGRWQSVYTGVAVVWDGGKQHLTRAALSLVKMRTLTEHEIIAASGKHLDKAGSYAVQEKGDGFVSEIRGDYDNVVGLPMKVVKQLLSRLSHPFPKNI